ncbi:outer membrane lipid asymmetry maintenance protein MlaD [Nitrospirillum viridazoti]|uniref:Outer membrane lipid asymmetry maintenance protein MlaD n=1 Tax=Nitrospirillum viridazoti CBAmc TaxID=1441467 RepID=A0A248JU94_9PROT|nr:outer membrane lipid asymmetry maintenance protein MlaD [Nitrospirillum amazonense]ASG22096.1 outer membrane lipid asymmetry maintenance protein MlaD [Nitrospirillum amazonense CBAmc]TWB32772.1 phospholipid/cholesterol/gamma-HCH transport system substrate-binding protein [Nitrospirillum amazonense]
MRSNVIETVLGAVVLVVAAFFLYFAYTTANVRAVSGYALQARFASTGGLTAGSDVRISGVKVGSVTKAYLDPKTYQAVIEMQIDSQVKLPEDTSAGIASESLLGGKFLNLQPGGEEEMLKPGGRIQYTQSAVNLEDLLGRFIFSAGGSNANKGGDGQGQQNQGQPAQPAPQGQQPAQTQQPKADPSKGLLNGGGK